MNREYRVTFEPSGRSVFVLDGTIILEAAGQAGYIIHTPCGGVAGCGKCLVRVTSGSAQADAGELKAIGSEAAARGYRLACRCRVHDNLTVEIPETSLFQTSQKILSHAEGGSIELKPRTVCGRVHVPAGVDAAGLKSLAGSGCQEVHGGAMREMPQAGGPATITVVDGRLVRVEPGEVAGRCCGVAFDIGTTTLVGTLVDLVSGEDLAIASQVNPQTSYGDDVVSRIKMCRDESGGLGQLRGAVLGAVNAIIGRLVAEAGTGRDRVYEAVFAGNTAMQEILCGINPEALGEIPFLAAFNEPQKRDAAGFGVDMNPAGLVHVFPQIGGFVGGDTVAGIISTRLDRAKEPALLLDVGTNGEIVLSNRGELTAISVAAGPAFEGARIRNGMRGTTGAIEKAVVADGDIRLNVIGNTKAAGICGSGLIDIMAELLRAGIVDCTGRVQAPDELPGSLPVAMRERVVEQEGGRFAFLLVDGSESATGKSLYLYQQDVRELQLANAAIRAGINILLRRAGLSADSLGSVLLAGAFGNFIRRGNARRIGMLPRIPVERIRFMGNTASFGAKMVLLSEAEEEYAAAVTRATSHFDLSLDPGFQDEFSEAMIFPDGE